MWLCDELELQHKIACWQEKYIQRQICSWQCTNSLKQASSPDSVPRMWHLGHFTPASLFLFPLNFMIIDLVEEFLTMNSCGSEEGDFKFSSAPFSWELIEDKCIKRGIFPPLCTTAHCWLFSRVSVCWRLCLCRELVHGHTGAPSAKKSIPRHALGWSLQYYWRAKLGVPFWWVWSMMCLFERDSFDKLNTQRFWVVS